MGHIRRSSVIRRAETDTLEARLESAFDSMERLVLERDALRGALQTIADLTRPPHTDLGKACRVDACIGCLIEATARKALKYER